jgi:hypothetical protein
MRIILRTRKGVIINIRPSHDDTDQMLSEPSGQNSGKMSSTFFLCFHDKRIRFVDCLHREAICLGNLKTNDSGSFARGYPRILSLGRENVTAE